MVRGSELSLLKMTSLYMSEGCVNQRLRSCEAVYRQTYSLRVGKVPTGTTGLNVTEVLYEIKLPNLVLEIRIRSLG